jgi:hypothetical protein
MTSPRARWLAARTRNAIRHGLIVAGTGAIVMIAALLTFVLLPRQADRALSNAIAALPPARDTLLLNSQRVRAESLRVQAEAQRTTAQVAVAATLAGLGTTADSLVTAAMLPVLARDTVLRNLSGQLARARQSPLVESYRALAEAPALQRDARAHDDARWLLDSIEVLNREREAYATLSGPDARYAEMTARLTALGTRLVELADGVLREQTARRSAAMLAAIPSPVADSAVPGVRVKPPFVTDSMLAPPDSALVGVAAAPLMPPSLLPDSLLDVAVRVATDSVARLESLLVQAHRSNAEQLAAKEALRSRMQVQLPPVAMLLASLVLGVSVGFAVSVWREMRHPTVGDAQELEQITRSRVIVYRGDEGTRLSPGFATRFGTRLGTRFGRRTRRGEAQVPVISPAADAWPLLHLTLSHIGDMARHVQVLADRPVVAGAVGLNLAAVAARESRATVLVDAAQRAGSVVPLLPVAALVRSDSTSAAALNRDAAVWDSTWDASRALPLGRDASVAIVLPRRARHEAGTRGRLRPEASAPELLEPLLRQYDFVVFVTDVTNVPLVPPSTDLVLCARLGVTPLDWVARAVKSAEEHGRRIRAVVLWAEDVPLAG